MNTRKKDKKHDGEFTASGYSDDCSGMTGLEDVSEYDVQMEWWPFIVDGKRVGVCSMIYRYKDYSDWVFVVRPDEGHTITASGPSAGKTY